MSESFKYDVFLSHSSGDKSVARKLAERLRDNGLNIWLDEWSIRPGDDVFLKIEDGLEHSRVLVLLMSSSAFGSEWVKLERSTVLFRDPTNDHRRFIPLLVKDCQIPDTIRRYKYVDWREQSDDNYRLLLDACSPGHTESTPVGIISLLDYEKQLGEETGPVESISLTLDGRRAVSVAIPYFIKVWDLLSGKCLDTFQWLTRDIPSVAISPDGKYAVSAAFYGLDIWDIRERKVKSIKGHKGKSNVVAVTPEGRRALSGSTDCTLRLWELNTGLWLNTFEGHKGSVNSVVASPDGRHALSGSSDGTLKLWDLDSGACLKTLDGHTSEILSVAITPDAELALSGSGDKTLKLWNLVSGACVATFEGHQKAISGVAISPNGKLAASASADKTIRIWRLETGECIHVLNSSSVFYSVTFSPDGLRLFAGTDDGAYVYRLQETKDMPHISGTRSAGVRYTNAKVVLLGESGMGKTGLGYRLAEGRWKVTDSTHGMNVWPLALASSIQQPDIEREVWLWDFAGQPEYRLVHQLFLDETALALVLFDAQGNDPFDGLDDWERSLRMAVGHDPVKLLVAARIDRGGAALTEMKINQFCNRRKYSEYIATSAKLNTGCFELRQAIAKYIPWDRLPWISTTRVFKVIKDAIVLLRDEGIVLIRLSELRQRLQMILPDEVLGEDELNTVIGLLVGQALVKSLGFGQFVLLQPEQLNNYASAVVRAAREHVDGIGCINERDVLEGKFDFKDMVRLEKSDEEILLRAMVQTFLDQSLCIREETTSGVQLVFPSQFNREIELPAYPRVFVSYRFSGHLPTIYTTLVVRLNYSDLFEEREFWKNAVMFQTLEGKRVGLIMNVSDGGIGEIKIFFDDDVPDDIRVTFIKYVHEHLLKRAQDVQREREYVCPKCGRLIEDRQMIKERLESGKTDIGCISCDARIPLIDLIELKFNEDRFLRKVQDLDAKAKINLDNESLELLLVGQAISIAAEAGQIYRGYTNSDWGIDGEIEFKDYEGRASGKRVYLQLKSGDSYLYRRQSDDKQIFTVKNERHLDYWQSQAYPVYLVIRTSDGVIRWMNITEYLQQRDNETSRQIEFKGEPLTAYTLMRLRDEHIKPAHQL